MSNYLAIATVTATLGQVIGQAMNAVPQLSASPEVRPGRPESQGSPFVGANLYLYRVAPNAALRNQDLGIHQWPDPAGSAAGPLIQRPIVALDLDYLLTFYGDERQLEPQRLLGRVMTTLHAEPVLTPVRIQETINLAGPSSFLAGSNLDQQVERVKFTLIEMSLEELSKLWTVFFQQTHALSVAYRGSVVLLEADVSPVAIKEVKEVRITLPMNGEPTANVANQEDTAETTMTVTEEEGAEVMSITPKPETEDSDDDA